MADFPFFLFFLIIFGGFGVLYLFYYLGRARVARCFFFLPSSSSSYPTAIYRCIYCFPPSCCLFILILWFHTPYCSLDYVLPSVLFNSNRARREKHLSMAFAPLFLHIHILTSTSSRTAYVPSFPCVLSLLHVPLCIHFFVHFYEKARRLPVSLL